MSMFERLQKIKEARGGKELEPRDREAKMSVVDALRGAMENEMGKSVKGKIDGLKKVSVMSDSPEGLHHGLETAKHLLDASHSGEHSMGESADEAQPEDSAEESSETPEEEASEESEESPEGSHDEDAEYGEMDKAALDEKLKRLMALKAKLHKA